VEKQVSGTDGPLTIVICSDFGGITGGQAKVAIESAIGLKNQGHRPILFAATGPIDEALRAAGVETLCLEQHDLVGNPSRLAAAVQGTWNRTAVGALQKLLADLPKDQTIIHVHGWAKAMSPAIAHPIAASGLPAVYTMHEYFLFCPNGGFYNYRKSHICTLQPLSAQCWLTHCDSRTYARKLWRNARLTIADKIAHLPEVFSDFITISGFQSEIIAPFLPRTSRVHRLSNPISIADPGPRPVPRDADFLFVGRISMEKGPFLFAEAARRLGRIPVYVGDGPLAGELAQRYPQARILGWQKADQVHRLMRQARALVFPSLWYEGQPLTILEAKALGVPIIVADTCAGRDEVQNDATGLWFKGGDVDDLARAMRALEDDDRVAQFSRAAYDAYWFDPPSLDRHVAGLTKIYRGMLAARAGTADTRPLARAASYADAPMSL
jgi:glycosyltransferase involved in cell wall biosynthesis